MRKPWPPTGTHPLAIDVVSVQSQVVYGRVGNNVAVPTLRALGYVVAAVPTVLFSNTPHYASMHGGAIPDAWFAGWLDDLVKRGALDRLRAIQCGYLGGPSQARLLAKWIDERLAARPQLCVVVDPVIGDHEVGVYVDPQLVATYRDSLLGLADGLTPNDFELAQLTGMSVASLADTLDAARSLLLGRTQWVAVTSAAPATWAVDRMRVVLVTRSAAWVVEHPRLDAEPKGTGDLFATCLLGSWLDGVALPDAAVAACRSVLLALRATRAQHCAELLLPRATAESDRDAITLSALTTGAAG